MSTSFWSDLTDVASSGIGGKVLFATDDWFARCEYLISPQEPVFDPNAFTNFGKLMDGWETRRKRIAGHDWCILQLAAPSRVYGLEVDTAFFTGNQTPRISIQGFHLSSNDVLPKEETMRPQKYLGIKESPEGGFAASEESLDAVSSLRSEEWPELLPMTPLQPGYPDSRHHHFTVSSPSAVSCGSSSSSSATTVPVVTHLRINMYPDGGIARIRVRGEIVRALEPHVLVDVAAASNGGAALGSSNAHYGRASNLIAPGRSQRMDQGWETARNPMRPAILKINEETGMLDLPKEMGEWALVRLAGGGSGSGGGCPVSRVEVDTDHFKGNCPETMEIEYANIISSRFNRSEEVEMVSSDHVEWLPMLSSGRERLVPHSQHAYDVESGKIVKGVIATHIRLRMYPDGGIARLRVYGMPTEESGTGNSKM